MPVMSEGKKNKKQLNSAQLVNIINEHLRVDNEGGCCCCRTG